MKRCTGSNEPNRAPNQIMPANALYFLASAIYVMVLIAALRLLRTGAHGPRATAWPVTALFACAAAVHAYLLWHGIFSLGGLNMNLANAMSLIVWLTVALHVCATPLRVSILHPLLAASAAVVLLLPLLIPGGRVLPYADSLAFRLHFLVAIFGYGLYTVATLHALIMWFAEHYLHEARVPAIFASLPPLMQMEKLLFTLLWLAFVFLTLTLVTGVFFSEALFGKAFELTYKTVFAVFSWVIFGGLLVGRVAFGWRGLLAVRWTLIGFLMLLLSYVGSKFVLEIILHRA